MQINEIRPNIFQKFIPEIKKILGRRGSALEKQPVTDVFEKQHSTSGIKSKTIKKLFSEEFRPVKNVDENKCRITTIIDKKTKKPVEAFVAGVETEEAGEEKYVIMVKDKAGEIKINDNAFKKVGDIYFYLDRENNIISPKFELINIDGELYERVQSYMRSYGNNDYEGIGIRLHQLRIERMLQEKMDNIMIVAEGNSFPFHYNMGFRLSPNFVAAEDMKKVIGTLSDINGKNKSYNKKFIRFCYQNGEKLIDYSGTLENFLNDYYKKGGKTLDYEPNMFLDKASAEQWINYIKTQPILF